MRAPNLEDLVTKVEKSYEPDVYDWWELRVIMGNLPFRDNRDPGRIHLTDLGVCCIWAVKMADGEDRRSNLSEAQSSRFWTMKRTVISTLRQKKIIRRNGATAPVIDIWEIAREHAPEFPGDKPGVRGGVTITGGDA